MKKIFIISALGAMLMASCADEFDTNNYVVDRPAQTAAYAYLNDYQTLKSYVDHSKYPNFKLGVGTTASDYIKKELTYALITSNFDETEPGNCMKMGSCVNYDNGSMDFGTVSEYVSTATEAGLSVYGHTLAWHAQQPVKWLNSLLKDKELDIDPTALIETLVSVNDFTSMQDQPFPYYAMGVTPPIINGAMHFEPTGDWSQFFIFPGGQNTLTEGNYLVRLYMAANKGADGVQLTIQNGWGGDADNKTMPVPVEEGDLVYELKYFDVKGGNYDCILKPQTADAVLDVKKIEFYKLESPAVEVEKEVNFYTYETKPDGKFPHYPMGCEPPIVNGALHFVPDGNWSQFFVVPGGDNQLDEGDYVFYVDMAANKEASGVQLTVQNGWGGDAQQFTAAIAVEAGRHTYALKFPGLSGSPSKNYDCILKPQNADATLDFYSLKVCKVEKLNSIPLTDEEKKDTLTWAMDRWISGMMEACEGRVKAWDAVNEAISGADLDGDGIYDLQHGKEGDTQNFFWQDYLGDYDYVPTVIRLAREHGPEDVKLFINDYNLESDWDDNAKLKSLIKWIERWETPVNGQQIKIDGIGSQMHLKYYANANIQKSKENHITKMFELMRDWANAGSGRFIRVSELDIEYVDANGKNVSADAMTEDQLHEIANFYKWIVQQYMSIIPADRQWGICSWSVVDADPSVSWTHQQLYGYWNKEYYRTHSYAGLADGLSGK